MEFSLERMVRAVDGLVGVAYGWLRKLGPTNDAEDTEAATRAGVREETEEFRTTRVDTGGGPEVIVIERK